MKKIFYVLGLALSATFISNAQTTSSFFLDNNAYSYRLNPAIMSEKSFFGLGVGNITMGLDSDLGINSFVYPSADGQGLVTAFHPSVSEADFKANFKSVNNIGFDADINLLAIGKRRENKLSTLELNLRSFADASIAGDFFSLLKFGPGNNPLDLSNTQLNANMMAELAIGRAFLNDSRSFAFGFRVKGLVGLANLDVNLNNSKIYITDTQASVDLNAQANIALSPLKSLKTDESGKIIPDMDINSISPTGYGGAVDLGISWKPTYRLELTASIVDLGLINWKYNAFAESKGAVEFNGLNITPENGESVKQEIETLKSDLGKLLNLETVNASKSTLSMLPFTARAGIRYQLPLINIVKVGALGTYTNGIVPSWDARVGATLTPFKALSLSANIGKSSFGDVCGAGLSLSVLFLNLFVSCDAYKGNIALYTSDNMQFPYPIENFNYKVTAGLTMQFGNRYCR